MCKLSRIPAPEKLECQYESCRAILHPADMTKSLALQCYIHQIHSVPPLKVLLSDQHKGLFPFRFFLRRALVSAYWLFAKLVITNQNKLWWSKKKSLDSERLSVVLVRLRWSMVRRARREESSILNGSTNRRAVDTTTEKNSIRSMTETAVNVLPRDFRLKLYTEYFVISSETQPNFLPQP